MLRVERVDEIAVVRVHGDVDIASAPQFESCINLLRDEKVLVIDLALCPYFDSSGFSVLYRAIQNLQVIVFMPADCRIRRVFNIAGVGIVFSIFETEIEALNAACMITSPGKLA
ncbi:MAG: hypothetical protein NVSMB64_23170 [Candidatus Velthaea sp.]